MLKKARIINFRSLQDITLEMGNLTVIVGANSTGKSNCLKSLSLFSFLVKLSSPLPAEIFRDLIRGGEENQLHFEYFFELEGRDIRYNLSLKQAEEGKIEFSEEQLCIGEVILIDVKSNSGQIRDEDGSNEQKFFSKEGKLALNTTVNFGDKPLTSKFYETIKSWEFFNLKPSDMRRIKKHSSLIRTLLKEESDDVMLKPSLDPTGRNLESVLLDWYKTDRERFDELCNEVNECLGIGIFVTEKDEKVFLEIQEIDNQTIKLTGLSDGTLRIIAYYVLLFVDNIPSLIGIEEPERNLHPAILKNVADVLKRLAQKTQVVITTHSPQLLDCFNVDELNNETSIMLLSKQSSCGTKIFQLSALSKEREDLVEWMTDFGIGSAVYDSNLLEKVLT